MTGTVTAAAGFALAGICAVAVDPTTGNTLGFAATVTNGTYRIDGLAAGHFTVRFTDGCGNPGDYTSAVYPKAVPVTAGQTTKHINADLTAS